LISSSSSAAAIVVDRTRSNIYWKINFLKLDI